MSIIATITTATNRTVEVGTTDGFGIALDVRETFRDGTPGRYIPTNLSTYDANALVAAIIEALGEDYAGAAVPADPEPPEDEGGAEATFYIDRERASFNIPGVGSFVARYEFVGA